MYISDRNACTYASGGIYKNVHSIIIYKSYELEKTQISTIEWINCGIVIQKKTS